jgi:hypothetical protein
MKKRFFNVGKPFSNIKQRFPCIGKSFPDIGKWLADMPERLPNARKCLTRSNNWTRLSFLKAPDSLGLAYRTLSPDRYAADICLLPT